MSWHYQVGKKTVTTKLADEEVTEVQYGMVEVYEIDGKTGYTEDFVSPMGESKRELQDDIRRMLAGIRDHPVLDMDT